MCHPYASISLEQSSPEIESGPLYAEQLLTLKSVSELFYRITLLINDTAHL